MKHYFAGDIYTKLCFVMIYKLMKVIKRLMFMVHPSDHLFVQQI